MVGDIIADSRPTSPGIRISWHRFSAISLWILALFFIYVTASEFSHLFGPDEMRRLLFTRPPSDLQLNRRQRLRELLRLSRAHRRALGSRIARSDQRRTP
jgi:hypothetical protein